MLPGVACVCLVRAIGVLFFWRIPSMFLRFPRLAALTLAATLTTALTLPVAHAHNVWLLPSSTVLSKPDWVTVDAAVSNDLFFFNHRPLGVQNLAVTAPDGSAVSPEAVHSGRLRTVFDLNLKQRGTYRIAVVSNNLFASYKDASGQPRRWRGTVEAFASEVPADANDLKVIQAGSRVETFVTAGNPSPITPTGQGLEILPLTAPADFAAGEAVRFVLHLDGQPAVGVDVTIVAGGRRYRDHVDEVKLKTDARGEFSITWPAPNMYWIHASVRDDKASVPHASERRMSYSGTVEVQP